MAKRLLSSVSFASLLAYSPRGTSDISRKSRTVCYGIKADRADVMSEAVARLEKEHEASGLQEFLGPEVVLVPTPRSAPLVEYALWPAERICQRLVDAGLGSTVERVLVRTEAVPKSSFSQPGDRPSVDRHLGTIVAEPLLLGAEHITVVDDVITKGRTLYAAVCLVQEAFPKSEVRAFTLVRTMGLVPEIESIVDPCVGKISYRSGDVKREP